MSWASYADAALAIAGGLKAMGIGPTDHVLLLVGNRPEFHVFDVACMMVGAIPVSVYKSPSVDRLAYIADHSQASAWLVEDAAFASQMIRVARMTGAEFSVIGIDADTSGSGVVLLIELLGAERLDMADVVRDVRPEQIATMLYTSGTTGQPKGVPLSHGNLVFSARTLERRLGTPMAGLRQLSYLPMAHIGERLATHYLAMMTGTLVTCCPNPADVDIYIKATRPQFLFGAPRLWERLRQVVQADADRGRDVVRNVLHRRGLAEVAVAITGSAAMPGDVHEFWLACGVPLADCYGQTESGGVGTWDPRQIVVGTSGRTFDGVELAISAGGEILLRSPGVFGGYYRDPERTSQILDSEGWYHTGDLGALDDSGNLVVAGRRDDMLVPTSGHNVSPTGIESMLSVLPGVGHAIVIGDRRPHLAALLILDHQRVREWAIANGLGHQLVSELVPGSPLREEIERGVQGINETLPGSERVRAVRIITDEWTLDSDVLTATGKLRRASILKRYHVHVDQMYATGN